MRKDRFLIVFITKRIISNDEGRKIKNLLKKFFNRSLSSAEKENLYFLISEEKFNDVISGELYKLWENADKEPIPVSPEKSFWRY
jgi:hypothetical protein